MEKKYNIKYHYKPEPEIAGKYKAKLHDIPEEVEEQKPEGKIITDVYFNVVIIYNIKY